MTYGLGTENQDLPAFVVLPDPAGGIKGGPPAYGAGFLVGLRDHVLRPRKPSHELAALPMSR